MPDCLTSTWTGWDGSVWDLNDDGTGVCLGEGVRGLSMPPVSHFRSESPVISGSRYRGSRTRNREVFWPLRIWHHGTPTQYLARDRAFWKTMWPNKTGTWSWTTPAGTTRHIDLRFESDDGMWETDPTLYGFNTYGVSLVAEQPYWRGDPVEHTFTNDGSVLLTNPGDVRAFAVWTLVGPISAGAIIGQIFTGGQTIPIPDAVPSGQTLTVYTHPGAMVALFDDGTEMLLTDEAHFPGVPQQRTHQVAFSGSGTITVSLTSYYYRAY